MNFNPTWRVYAYIATKRVSIHPARAVQEPCRTRRREAHVVFVDTTAQVHIHATCSLMTRYGALELCTLESSRACERFLEGIASPELAGSDTGTADCAPRCARIVHINLTLNALNVHCSVRETRLHAAKHMMFSRDARPHRTRTLLIIIIITA